MHIDHLSLKLLAAFLLVAGYPPAAAMAQHVHGVVELGVVVEDDTVAVSLSAPMSDVVGFEHEPKNDDQENMVRQAASMLSDPDAMFGLAESVDCEVSSTTIDGPDYILKYLAKEGGASASHDDHLGHDDHHHEHDDHQHEHDEHADVVASYEWKCGGVSGLDSLDLRFSESFANVETIKIQILTADGAQVLTAEGRVASISL